MTANSHAHQATRRARFRRRTIAVALGVTLVGAGAQIAPASAAGAVTNLGTPGLVITGKTFAPGATIPVGTQLAAVQLTTDDEVTGSALAAAQDPFTLVTGELVTVKANGTTLATTLPAATAVALRTNAGTISALAFSSKGNTYIIPGTAQSVVGASSVTTASRLNIGSVSRFDTFRFGLFPVGSTARSGTLFTQVSGNGQISPVGPVAVTLYDADNVRRNTDSIGEEVVIEAGRRVSAEHAREVTATVQLTSGAIVSARALQLDIGPSTYDPFIYSYFFLESTVNPTDVQQVNTSTNGAHSLTWSQLGF